MLNGSYDRSLNPEGFYRQLLAGFSHGNRKSALTRLKIQALIIHGTANPIVPVEAGKDTAEAIPNAELMLIEGMGHDIPKLGGARAQITDRIIEFITQLENQIRIVEAIMDLPISIIEIADDLAANNGYLVSPEFIAQQWLPRADKLVKTVKQMNVPIQWHCCG